MKKTLIIGLGLCALATACPHLNVRRDPVEGLELVRVPGGQFQAGCIGEQDAACAGDERPRTANARELWVGKTEVPVRAYASCVKHGGCAPAPLERSNQLGGKELCTGKAGDPELPINCITFDEAQMFCAWIRGRLPTAVEWEHAARAGTAALYPWGNQPADASRARLRTGGGAPGPEKVGARPDGANALGLQDLAGNLAEWTASDSGGEREVRGGSWKDGPEGARISRREGHAGDKPDSAIGFRCVQDDAPQ